VSNPYMFGICSPTHDGFDARLEAAAREAFRQGEQIPLRQYPRFMFAIIILSTP